MFKRLAALAAVVMVCGLACISTNAVRLGDAQRRPAISWKDVKVYQTADKVPGKYEEMALLNSTGDALWTNEAGMFRSMMKRAASIGANGIILNAMSEPGAGAKVAAAFLGVPGADRKGKAVAIYVFPPENK
jgi:hypothetical protein